VKRVSNYYDADCEVPRATSPTSDNVEQEGNHDQNRADAPGVIQPNSFQHVRRRKRLPKLVTQRRVAHPDIDYSLTEHITSAKLRPPRTRGDDAASLWQFSRFVAKFFREDAIAEHPLQSLLSGGDDNCFSHFTYIFCQQRVTLEEAVQLSLDARQVRELLH
jgi:hypothetical protein